MRRAIKSPTRRRLRRRRKIHRTMMISPRQRLHYLILPWIELYRFFVCLPWRLRWRRIIQTQMVASISIHYNYKYLYLVSLSGRIQFEKSFPPRRTDEFNLRTVSRQDVRPGEFIIIKHRAPLRWRWRMAATATGDGRPANLHPVLTTILEAVILLFYYYYFFSTTPDSQDGAAPAHVIG